MISKAKDWTQTYIKCTADTRREQSECAYYMADPHWRPEDGDIAPCNREGHDTQCTHKTARSEAKLKALGYEDIPEEQRWANSFWNWP